MYACIYSARPARSALLECASGFAPTTDAIELCDERTVVFRVEGLGLLYGPLAAVAEVITLRARSAGLEAKVVIAHSVDAARLLARCPGAKSVEVVSIDETAGRVGSLSVRELGLTTEVEEVLALWGIKTLGDFARLPEEGLVQRFGPEAVRWHRLARGAIERPLITLEPDRTISEELDLDYEIELLDALMFGIGRLLNSLCERLIESGLATDEVTVVLDLAGVLANSLFFSMPPNVHLYCGFRCRLIRQGRFSESFDSSLKRIHPQPPSVQSRSLCTR